ncbi:MAG: hypothetical protein H7Z75_15800 [Ferruginibacter sp.]|nr:hypothetical protein [Cytophagales bacterium]
MAERKNTDRGKDRPARGLEAEDYYVNEQGFIVFTAVYHLKRGYCCRSGCRHCPYGYKKES